jgi:signal transduction histidine kinase/tRNA A-37 threonylcarbamoyl transferase component Bud32/tetratricopeptide (TPR) repeat protein
MQMRDEQDNCVLPPGISHQGFEAQQTLSERHDVHVILARSRSGPPVVVKQARLEDGFGHRCVLRETRALQEVASAHLPTLVTHGLHDGLPFVVTQCAPGRTLSSILREGPLPVPLACQAFLHVARALAALHETGYGHFDVKPGNIVLEAVGASCNAILVDLGLARRFDESPETDSICAGTPRTMAPEQAGVLHSPVDARTDLYSLGASLFEALSGQPLVLGETLSEVLLALSMQGPRSVRALGIDVPRVVDDLVMRLTARDPDHRYQTASSVARDLSCLLDPSIPRSTVVGRTDRRTVLAAPAWVGREREVRLLREAVSTSRRGAGKFVVLRGESGSGKSRLLEEVHREAFVQHVRVFRGSTFLTDAPGSMRAFRQIADQCVDDAARVPWLARQLKDALSVHGSLLVALLPQLQTVLDTPPGSVRFDDSQPERRAAVAIAAWIRALVSPLHGAVVVLDDCQWADDVMRHVFEILASPRSGPEEVGPLLVAAYRSEATLPPGVLDHASVVEVSPLDREEVHALAESMAGPLPQEALAVLSDTAGGNPFFCESLLQGMVEQGIVVSGGEGWAFDRSRLDALQASRRAGLRLLSRLDDTPQDERACLEAGAVIGREFTVDQVQAVSALDSDVVGLGMENCLRRVLVWHDRARSVWGFAHDRIREAVLERASTERLRAMNERAAHWLETVSGQQARAATHYDKAGMASQGVTLALEAARRARSMFAFEQAESMLRIALRGMGDGSAVERSLVLEDLGVVLSARDRAQEAVQCLRKALALAQGDLDRARILGCIGRIEYWSGNAERAERTFLDGLSLLGYRVPRGKVQTALRLAGEAGKLLWKQRHPENLVPAKLPESTRIAADCLEGLTYLAWLDRGTALGTWMVLRRLNDLQPMGTSPQLGMAQANMAVVMSMTSLFDVGVAYGQSSARGFSALGDPIGRAGALHHEGIACFVAGRHARAIEVLEEAIPHLDRSGDLWQRMDARVHRAYAHLRLGNLRLAASLALALESACLEEGLPKYACFATEVLAKAKGGNIDPTRIEFLRKHAGEDVMQASSLDQAEAVHRLSLGRPDEAAPILEAIWNRILQSGFRLEYVYAPAAWLATAARLAAEQDLSQRRRWLRTARSALRDALLIASRFPNHRPHALTEAGLLAAMHGATAVSRRLLDRAVRSAEAFSARHDLAQALLARSRVGRPLGWPDALQDQHLARSLLDACGATMALGEPYRPQVQPASTGARALTHSLADRFDRLLDEGRTITTSLSTDQALDACAHAASGLLRSDIVVLAPSGREWKPVWGSANVGRKLVDGAVEGGTVCLAVETARDCAADLSESLILDGVRAALAVPILLDGHCAYVLCAVHRSTGAVFGPDEVRIAEFLSSATGAAIENATRFSHLEAAYGQLREAHASLRNAEAQLVQAGKLAAIGQLGAGIAHELGQPVLLIRGHAERLRRALVKAALPTDEVDPILHAVDRVAQIVDNVRRIARQQPSERTVFQAKDAVEDALLLVRKQLVSHGIHVVWEPGENTDCLIDGDRVGVQQVLLNLLSNACEELDALPASAPRAIEIRAAAAGDEVILSVQDTGRGVRADVASGLFEPFVTGRADTGGLGIGLSISRRMACTQGGDLRYVPLPDRGARFELVLPRSPR